MNRTGLFLLLAVAVLALGAYWLFAGGSNTMTASQPTAAPPIQAPADVSASAPVPEPVPVPEDAMIAPAPPPPGAGQGAPPPIYTTDDAPSESAPTSNDAAPAPAEGPGTPELAPDASWSAADGSGSSSTAEPAPLPPPPPLGPATHTPSMSPPSPPPPPISATAVTDASAPAAVLPQDFPIFPWPVPKASATQEIPRKLVVATDAAPTLGSVAKRITQALDRAGYNQHSYYAFADGHGVAIATQLEQINDDGSPKSGEARFQLKLAPLSTAEFSLTGYLKALFTARSGRFRVIVFALSTGVAQDAKSPDAEKVKTWATSGQTVLPARYASLAFSDQTTVTALIYEFEKKDYNTAAQFVVPGKINGMAHLMKAGIWSLLGK